MAAMFSVMGVRWSWVRGHQLLMTRVLGAGAGCAALGVSECCLSVSLTWLWGALGGKAWYLEVLSGAPGVLFGEPLRVA